MAKTDQYINQANQNNQQFQQQGNDLQDYWKQRQGYYNPLEEGYRQQADTAYGDLAQTPGYTSQETAGIMGNPNAAFNYYNPDQLSGDMEQGNTGVATTAANYGAGLREASDRTASGLGGAASGIKGDLYGAAGDYGTGVTNAANQGADSLSSVPSDQLDWQGGVYNYLRDQNEGSLDKYGNALDQATPEDKLALSSDFQNKYAMSPEEQQNIKDVAAQSTAGQYNKMSGEAKLRAAAEGNTSPAAMAAIEEQLGRQGAIDAGNAASSAELAANAQAASRQKDIESMRLGAQQDISGRQSANAGNLYQAQAGGAQNLAGLEQQGIQSATGNRLQAGTTGANLRYNAADTSGRAKMDAAAAAAGYGYNAAAGTAAADTNAADKGGQAQMGSAQFQATNRQNVDTGNQQTGQQLATAADTARSNRSGTVANQRITGQNNYRNYLTGQQGMQQQGGQAAGQGQTSAYGAQSGAQNTATGQTIQGQLGQNQIDKQPGEGERIGMGLVKTFFDKGGVATEPTLAVIGERGPEMVVPANGQFDKSKYMDGPGKKFGRYGRAA